MGDHATASLGAGRFHDAPPMFYASLIEHQLRHRFGEVEATFVEMIRCSPIEAVVGGLHMSKTLQGAYRIWRAERRGRNRRAILRAADRRIIALEEVQ